MYYMYFYIDPRTDIPFYVGKGSKNRAYDIKGHTNKQVLSRIHKLKKLGLDFKIEITCCINEMSALWLEKVAISAYGRKDLNTGPLFNHTPGGDNPPIHFGENNPAKRPEVRKILSQRQIGELNHNYGKKLIKHSEFMTINNPSKRDDVKNKMKLAWSIERRQERKKQMSRPNGRIWINDGNQNKQIKQEESIPFGFTKGRIMRRDSKGRIIHAYQ
jgi:hypothetical protein